MPLAAAALRRRAGRRRHGGRRAVALRQPLPRPARRASCSPRSPASRSRRRSRRSTLVEERRLKRRARRHPAAAAAVARRRSSGSRARTIAVSLPLLTLGLAAGLRPAARARAAASTRSMAATLVTWLVYGGFLALAADRPPGRASRARRLRARDPRPARPRREPLLMTLSLVGISHHVAPVELRERVDAAARPRRRARPRARRRRLPLDLQPHRGLPRRRRRARRARRRSRSSPASRSRASPTGCTTRRPRCISSASRPGSTRSSRARARSSARCAPRSTPPRPGPLLDRVFRQALAARQARPHRDGDRREPRVGPVGGRRARGAGLRRPRGRRVLLVGAGRIGELAAGEPRRRAAPTIAYVANRTPQTRARARARASAARRSTLDEVAGELGEVDVVLSSTSAPGP